ncbi:LysR family transcriptional regulator [Sandaracinobacteroides saxicola]|uniref:LysR family transcriptional regulator n=1 Tax=Sandaracinobacteroides saxicola TaxID=2759707 RepID=A0A7G5IDX9_9SPHN|nr:LysR family transcriptional regulator [Sandaracinobacteroides saxicola]QMW21571.1 LysR family transcriptional regulator [Sandaracinobacteroides saxicola]
MNLRGIDLNLLVVLDALLEEAHVSRAAHRLNLSQPAVSSALQRCRALFSDRLLERGRGGMTRTPLADTLRAPLRSILADVESLLDPQELPLDRIERVVRITTADDPAAQLACPLVENLTRTAPGVTVVFRPWLGQDSVVRELLDGDTDIAIAVFDREIENVEIRPLFDADYVVAMRTGHPAAAAFDLNAWLAYPHVVVSGRAEWRTPLDPHVSIMGHRRRVGLVVPSFQLVPAVLAATDLIAMLPRQSIAAHAHPEFALYPPPVAVDGFTLKVAWHSRQNLDRAVQHVTGIVRETFETASAQPTLLLEG